jgi:hypothetical protein
VSTRTALHVSVRATSFSIASLSNVFPTPIAHTQ